MNKISTNLTSAKLKEHKKEEQNKHQRAVAEHYEDNNSSLTNKEAEAKLLREKYNATKGQIYRNYPFLDLLG